jgi:alpha-galactosidase
VRAGFEAIRRGAGADAFLLGCGAPIASSIGLVDGMRIGPDVAPWWEPREHFPGYAAVAPSTANALRATQARQFMHRRLWLNDPDCVMLRTTATDLTPAEARRWALAVGDSGGMVLVSDDLSLLGANERSLLDEVIARGREADAQAIGSTGST